MLTRTGTVNKYSRRDAIVQAGWKTQSVSCYSVVCPKVLVNSLTMQCLPCTDDSSNILEYHWGLYYASGHKQAGIRG
jgi:hypothetical protein